MPSPPAVRRPSSLGLFAVLVVFVLSLLMVEESAAQNRLPRCPESRKVVWTNCQGTLKYSDGTYTGGWLSDQWHGQGHLRTDAGVNYKGQFANHKYHGKGTLILPNGEEYTGDFLAGKFHGRGQYKKRITSYDGPFQGNDRDKKLAEQMGFEVYEGDFKNGLLHGFAAVTYKSGELTRYEGEFQNGSRHGKGKALFRNGQTYDGEWKDNLIDGYGILEGSKGEAFEIYEGHFSRGKFDGQGRVLTRNKLEYIGSFKDGNFNGHGTIIIGITRTTGIFTNGALTGHGQMTSSDGASYRGQYRNNLRHGTGTKIYADGSKYSGEWTDDKSHGQGTADYTDNTRYTGQWIKDKRDGKGTLLHLASGMRFEGEWSADRPSGKATIWMPSGIILTGTFNGSTEEIHGDVGIQFPNGERFRGLATLGSRAIPGALYHPNGTLKSKGTWEKGTFTESAAVASLASSREIQPSATEFHARMLSSIIDTQNALLKSASPLEKGSVEATLKIVTEKLDALKKDLASRPALNTGYLTSVRPDNANTYITARRASELYPKIPYYIPGTRETGEFWVEPVVSNAGAMTFALKFVDVGSTSVEKVRGQIDMTLSETEEVQKALFKLHDWSKTAREQRIRTNFDKRVTCFPEPECPPDGERVEGKASTEIRFFVFEDGSTGGRIQRNKGRFTEAYSVSIDSALLLQAYLSHVIKEAKLEFQAGTQDRRTLQELFR
jgi:hypothetical protein